MARDGLKEKVSLAALPMFSGLCCASTAGSVRQELPPLCLVDNLTGSDIL